MTDDAPQVTEGQVTEQVTPQEDGGQAQQTVADTEVQDQPTFEDRLSGLLDKKKWTKDNWQEQILNAYGELETKLGGYSELTRKANDFDRLNEQSLSWHEKADLWDRAQQRLKDIEEQGQLENGQLDLSQAPIQTLARLYTERKIGFSDIPTERQYDVQQFVAAQEAAIQEGARKEALELSERHPILKNAEVAELIASQIERGVIDQKTGKELSPEEIIVKYENLVKYGEKQAEDRYKAETERLKKGNLEQPGSAVTTTNNTKVKTVADAFRYAQERHSN